MELKTLKPILFNCLQLQSGKLFMLLSKIILSIITIVFCGSLYTHKQQSPWSSVAVCVCGFVYGYKCAWVHMPLHTHIEVRGQQRILPLVLPSSFVVVILR